MAGGSQAEQGTLTKGTRITGDQRSSLAEVFGARYARGESIRSIAQDTGRSYGFVHGVLKESGASLRGRGGATRGPRRGALSRLEDQVDAVVDGAASPARTKAKAARSADKNGRSKDSSKDNKDAKDGKVAKAVKAVKAAVKDEKPKKKVEAKKSGKKSGKKG